MYKPRLQAKYKDEVAPALKKQFSYKTVMQVPKLQKIVLNQGLGSAVADKRMIEAALTEMSMIAGQKAISTKSKKDISNFKLRKGMPIGVKVTLRGDKMYEFLDRFITVVLPRLRDFHGVSAKAFDKQGNFAIGLVDQSVFPELTFEETTTAHGLQAIFTISGGSPAYSRALLEKFGMPFEKEIK